MMGKGEREKGERKIEIEKRGDRKRDRDTGRERHRKMTEGHKERGKDRQRDRETDNLRKGKIKRDHIQRGKRRES